jgi:hydrogenase maturation factor
MPLSVVSRKSLRSHYNGTARRSSMNIVSGEIVEIYIHEGTTMAAVSVGGAVMRVPILLLSDAKVGDVVLIESGIALSRIEHERVSEK